MTRRPAKWIPAILLLVALPICLAKPAALFYARKMLASHFPDSRTGLQSIGLSLSQISLQNFFVESAGWRIEGTVTADWRQGRLASAHLVLPFLTAGDFEIKQMELLLPPGQKPGSLTIRRIRYKKIVLGPIQGVARIENNSLLIEPVGASGPYGSFSGTWIGQLENQFPFQASLDISNLALGAILHDMEWDTKAKLTGVFSGGLLLAGNRLSLVRLDGLLTANPPGGNLDIVDPVVFSDLAKRTQQPQELIEAGLSRYHFDTGSISISSRQRDLHIELLLEGPAGKRRLEPVIHDFFKKEPE